MTIRVLDPTNEAAPPAGEPARRLGSLRGTTIGFISNGK
ncbi:MAG: UGSC family (seleno)protein, partial [Hyphomicrobiaceae bacterium]